ncbi:MAG: Flp family type IVb pilin [Pseudolabrys sp.]|nr:Flp family type IVb pilin [Pseudolabrys sp.]
MRFTSAVDSLKCFIAARAGTTAIEYALIASGIAAVLVAVVAAIGATVSGMLAPIATGLG